MHGKGKNKAKIIVTRPEVADSIIAHLNGWRTTTVVEGSNITEIQLAEQQQATIGWQRWLYGRAAIQWQRIQKTYYDELGVRKSSRRWLIAVNTLFINIAWDMWENRNDIVHEEQVTVASLELQQQVQQIVEQGRQDWGIINNRVFDTIALMTEERRGKQSGTVLNVWLARMELCQTEHNNNIGEVESEDSSNIELLDGQEIPQVNNNKGSNSSK